MTATASTDLTFRIDNLVDPAKRVAWVALLQDIWGLDFSAFSALDIWPTDYRAYSYLAGDTIVANICCNSLPLRVAGQNILAGQLQGVATRPSYRRQGLFQDLIQKVLAFADTRFDCMLLYTETPALYQPFGFRLMQEHGFRGHLRVAGLDRADPVIQSLSVHEAGDVSLIRRLFTQRQPISDHLGIVANEGVFFGNLMLRQGLHLSYLPAFDSLVVWDENGEGGRRRLLDLVGAAWPPMDILAATLRLPLPDVEIDVLFAPDRLTGDFVPRPYVDEDNDLLMVRGTFAMEHRPFMLPLTAVS